MLEIWKGNNLDFKEGQLILIDKPLEWSSFDAVKKVRNAIKKKLNIKKIKVGHAGTLDPLATGLLIMCTGRYTKKIEELQGLIKVYTGIMKLGATTPSFDLETEIDHEFETSHITEEKITIATQSLTGELDQVPPMFSAKKINGKRAYTYARKGEAIELKPKRILVSEFQTKTDNFPNVDYSITCSKGTYIRSLARDLGLELDSGAHLTALRREKIGDYSVDQAFDVETFIKTLNQIG